MADKISVTTHHSYGSRVKQSAKNILFGIILVIVSIILLAWNEKNFIKTKKSLDEWAAVVVEASANELDSSLEGKEVHVYWETASSAEALKDESFWIVVDDLKLARTVEMYQWYEESHESCTDNYWWSEDCTTTYEYKKDRSDDHINSSNFYESAWHSNPTNWQYESAEREKTPITLWVYSLDWVFTKQLTNYTDINLNEQNVINPAGESNSSQEPSIDDNNNTYLYDNNDSSANTNFHINGNHIYIGSDENSPNVWDLRITFSSLKEWTVSVIWKQYNNHITSYPTSIEGKSIALLEQWVVSAETMFANAQDANKTMTWIIRLVGLLLMFAGFAMMFELIETLAKLLPFLANILWVGTRIIAFCLTLVVWFVTIGIAWIAVRPVIWISCLVVAAAWITLLVKKKKNGKSSSEASNTESTTNEEKIA